MQRLRIESSCSYLGRSARHAVGVDKRVGLRATPKGVESPPNATSRRQRDIRQRMA